MIMKNEKREAYAMNHMTLDLMKELILRQHPGWEQTYAERRAAQWLAALDPRLGELLYTHCTTGKTPDFSYTHRAETFSVLEIRAMRRCSYLDAVLLMNAYICDPAAGRAKILRR